MIKNYHVVVCNLTFLGVKTLTDLFNARKFGPSEWGQIFLLLTVVNFRGLIQLGCESGLNYLLTTESGKRIQGEIFFSGCIVNILTTGLLGIILIPMFNYNQFANITTCLCLLSNLFFVHCFYFNLSYFRALQHKANQCKIYLLNSFLYPLLLILLLKNQETPKFFLLSSLAFGLSAIFTIPKGIWKERFCSKHAANLIKFGLPLTLGSIFQSFLMTSDRIIFGIFKDDDFVGQYSIVSILISAGFLLSHSFSSQIIPNLILLKNRGEKVKFFNEKSKIRSGFLPLGFGIIILYLFIGLYGLDHFLPAYKPNKTAIIVISLIPISLVYTIKYNIYYAVFKKMNYFLILTAIYIIFHFLIVSCVTYYSNSYTIIVATNIASLIAYNLYLSVYAKTKFRNLEKANNFRGF